MIQIEERRRISPDGDDFWGYLWSGKDSSELAANFFEWMNVTTQPITSENDVFTGMDILSAGSYIIEARDWVGLISPLHTMV